MNLNINTAFYEIHLRNVKSPEKKHTVFQVPNKNRLGVCLIEFRKLEWIKYVLFQVANVYGNTDTSLYIVHGTSNGEYVKNMLKDWTNVQFIEYPYDNVNREQYAELCCDSNLYKRLNTQFMLKIEWDSFIRKKIPDFFFQFSYVGAPWTGFPNDYPKNPHKQIGNKRVGNGGFSLRKVERMIEICTNHPKPEGLGEDVHITNCLYNKELPTVEQAQQFSVEWMYHPDPVGFHQIWKIFPTHVYSRWFVTD